MNLMLYPMKLYAECVEISDKLWYKLSKFVRQYDN
jgi:hypothetical protein